MMLKLNKDKSVKICVCGKDTGKNFQSSDWNQLSIASAIIQPAIALLFVLDLADGGNWGLQTEAPWVAVVLYSLVAFEVAAEALLATKYFRQGHSLKCSLKKAFFKVSGATLL